MMRELRKGRLRKNAPAWWITIAGVCCLFTSLGAGGAGMQSEEIPSEYSETRDPTVEKHIADMQDWAARAFSGQPRTGAAGRVELEVLQQDHSVLNFGRSCIETPITIGKQPFEHGLGTHAASVIAVAVPQGAKAFKASVGIDNNNDTQGSRGSVEFSIEIQGKEIFRTPVLRGGDEPVPVSIELPREVEKIVLKVDPTADGASNDQADWADAQFVMEDGTSMWLDAGQPDFLIQGARPPFSFNYGGKASAELLDKWPKEVQSRDEPARLIYTARWKDPDTGLCVTAEAATFKDYPAADWVIWFENLGKQDAPIIEDIQALDLTVGTGYIRNPVVLHRLEGDACGENSFMPIDSAIEAEKTFRLAPTGGLLCQFDYLNPDFPAERAKQLIDEAKGNQKYWYGDFYSLTPCTLSPEAFVAYQLHRPDLNEGVVYAFRRAECNYTGLILGLNGIDKAAQYAIELIDEKGEKTTRTLAGAELSGDLQLRVPARNAGLVLRYKKQ